MEAARTFLEANNPTTGRGVAYHLLSHGLIPSMGKRWTDKVYGLLTRARLAHDGLESKYRAESVPPELQIPWDWLVDETRRLERAACWADLADYLRDAPSWYQRDPWDNQEHRVEVWSEKGTVRGILASVLDEHRVGFRVTHGSASWPMLKEAADAAALDSMPMLVLYVGDWDPSGLRMSEADLPGRLASLGANVELRRVTCPTRGSSRSRRTPTARWFLERTGEARCWELDAMNPRALRDRVALEIESLIDREAWDASLGEEERELAWLRTLPGKWRKHRRPTVS